MKNNKKIGIATVTVTLKGKNYSGKMTKKFLNYMYFNLMKEDTHISMATV